MEQSVKDLAKAYGVKEPERLDKWLAEFINYLSAVQKDGYIDVDIWLYFLHEAMADLYHTFNLPEL